MPGSYEQRLHELRSAVDAFDRRTAREIVDGLISEVESLAEPYPAGQAKELLEVLRRKRFFDISRDLAEALLQHGQRSPAVYRHYAQALIDTGSLVIADQLITSQIRDRETRAEQDRSEVNELRGLLGRIHKQAYVNAARKGSLLADELLAAIDSYHSVYVESPQKHTWHGINVVALLHRAEEDGIEIRDFADRKEGLAQSILRTVEAAEQAGTATPWDFATAMEACLALERWKEAQGWLLDYLAGVAEQPGAQADAFEYGSTYRQLKEVWRLDVSTDPGGKLLPPLYTKLLQAQGGELRVESRETTARFERLPKDFEERLEKIFGTDSYLAMDWMQRALGLCRYVARIKDPLGNPFGTGFLVRGPALCERLSDQWYLLTNSHVISSQPEVLRKHDSLEPAEARIEFQGAGEGRLFRARKVCWESPPGRLDAALIELDIQPDRDVEAVQLRRREPARDSRLYVIGHPKGLDLQYSLHDNKFLGMRDPFVHYRTPTEGGSSGSPVFDPEWRLVALHHSGSWEMSRIDNQRGTYQANEGIWIPSIQKELMTSVLN
jgi:hypothetical protein